MLGLSIGERGVRRLLVEMSCLIVLAVTVIGFAPASGATTIVAANAPAGTKPTPTAYITNYQQGTVSVLHGAKVVGTISGVGIGPAGIALAPGDETAYVANFGYLNEPGDTVTPIDLATRTAGTPIIVGSGPFAIRITSNGKYAVVTLLGVGSAEGDEVVRINLADGSVSKPIKVGEGPQSLAISPDGTTAYVGSYGASSADASITPVDIVGPHPHALPPIAIKGAAPSALAMAPDGNTLYMTHAEGAQLVPISADVLKVSLPQLAVLNVTPTGGYPDGVGVANGWLYIANAASNDATVSHDGTIVGSPSIGEYPLGVAVVPAT